MKEVTETTKSYVIRDFYNHYLSSIDHQQPYEIDYKKYREIVTAYFKYLRDEVIERGSMLRLPCRLGHLFIVKRKPKTWTSDSLRIDFKTTKDLNKVTYHLNEHSNGFKYRFLWSKQDAIFINKSKYQLKMSRANKRRLAQIIKNRERDFVEI